MNNLLYDGYTVKNKALFIKKLIINLFLVLLVMASLASFICYKIGFKYGSAIGKADGFRDGKAYIFYMEPETFTNRWVTNLNFKTLIPDDMAHFITMVALEKDIDPDFCICILQKENPELNPNATSKPNENGTQDLGLWQLNNKYIPDFVKLFWDFNVKFDPYNWKHSTYIAISLLADHAKTFNGNLEKVAQAYNCGIGRTTSGDIPNKTEMYTEIVMKNYASIKSFGMSNGSSMLARS